MLSDHGADVVRVLHVVPAGREETGGDLAEKAGDVVQQDESDETGDNTVGDVVWNQRLSAMGVDARLQVKGMHARATNAGSESPR